MSAGELYALGAAITWAMAVILFKLSGDRMPPLSLNLFKTTLSLVLLVATLFVLGEPLFPDVPIAEYVLLLLSGIIGITLSDTLFFYGLNRLGAGLNSIVECLYSPSIILLSFLFLPNATLTLADAAGLGLILAALFLIASPRSGQAERRDLIIGIVCGGSAMVSLAVGVMIFIPIVDHVSVFWASAVRTFGAVLTLAALPLLRRDARHLFECFRPSAVWRWSIPGSILGTYVALLFWTLGFKYASSSRAAILNQSNTIFVLILATIFLRETITRRKILAIVLGIGGVVVVTWLGSGRDEPRAGEDRGSEVVGSYVDDSEHEDALIDSRSGPILAR